MNQFLSLKVQVRQSARVILSASKSKSIFDSQSASEANSISKSLAPESVSKSISESIKESESNQKRFQSQLA